MFGLNKLRQQLEFQNGRIELLEFKQNEPAKYKIGDKIKMGSNTAIVIDMKIDKINISRMLSIQHLVLAHVYELYYPKKKIKNGGINRNFPRDGVR